MQHVAQAWLVYRLTESSFMLGLVAFCSLIPVLLFSLYGGVLADRLDRWRLLFTAHSLGMGQAVLLAVLTLSGAIEPWHIIALALGLGLVHALEMPARHSFIPHLVPRAYLHNAIALNSSAFNIARFAGPAIAGVIVAHYGEGIVFAINAASFLAILGALLAMERPEMPFQADAAARRARLREGLAFAWNTRHVRAGLLIVAMMGLVAASVTVLMPVFAKEVYGGGSRVLGIMLGALGAGSLVGALLLARRPSAEGLDQAVGGAGVLAGLALWGFTALEDTTLALPVLVVIGLCQTTLVASTNTLIQLTVPDHLRGRTMSLFSMIFIGLMPLGSLLAGTLAQYLAVTTTSRVFATVCVLGSAVFLFRARRFQRLQAQREPGGRGEPPGPS